MEPLFRDQEIRFVTDVHYRNKGEVALNRLFLETDWASSEIHGQWDQARETMEGKYSIVVRHLSNLSPLIGVRMAGRLKAEGTFSGPMSRLNTHLSVALMDLEIQGLGARGVTLDLKAESSIPMSFAFSDLTLECKGRMKGLYDRNTDFPLPWKELDWSLEARLPADGPVSIRRFEVGGEDLAIRLSGEWVPSLSGFQGDAVVEVGDLQKVSFLTGLDISGKTRFHARVEEDMGHHPIKARVDGHVKDLHPLPPVLPALIQEGFSYAGEVEIMEMRHLTLSGLHMETASVKATGGATLDLLKKELRGLFHIQVPQIPNLSEAVGQDLQGSMEMDVEAGGAFSSLHVNTQARVKDLRLGAISFQEVNAAVHAEGIPERPKGVVTLGIRQADMAVACRSGINAPFQPNASNLLLGRFSNACLAEAHKQNPETQRAETRSHLLPVKKGLLA